MLDWKNYFKGKHITVMGMAAEGRGLQDALFALKYGATVTVTDLKPKQDLSLALKKLKSYGKKVTYVLGEHRLKDFTHTDLVIRSASAPLGSAELKAARWAGVPIHTDESLFFELAKQQDLNLVTVGVTGTRGKSTTTQLIYEIIKDVFPKVFLGGNLRGLATLPLLEKMKSGHKNYLVMELDSWKLQGLGEHGFSPQVAVFTNLQNDHMNYYQNDLDRYFADKANIFKYQTKSDYLILGEPFKNAVLKKRVSALKPNGKIILTKSSDVPKNWPVKLLGAHNRENVAAAIAAAQALGVPTAAIKKGVANFTGVAGRLQFLRSVSGVKYYNDNNATTPDATIAALRALLAEQTNKIILVGGGADKVLDYKDYAPVVKKAVKFLVLFKGAASDKIIKALGKTKLPIVTEVDSMPKALAYARAYAAPGDIILLSPGAASFGVFQNEYDRGDQFVKLVQSPKIR